MARYSCRTQDCIEICSLCMHLPTGCGRSREWILTSGLKSCPSKVLPCTESSEFPLCHYSLPGVAATSLQPLVLLSTPMSP